MCSGPFVLFAASGSFSPLLGAFVEAFVSTRGSPPALSCRIHSRGASLLPPTCTVAKRPEHRRVTKGSRAGELPVAVLLNAVRAGWRWAAEAGERPGGEEAETTYVNRAGRRASPAQAVGGLRHTPAHRAAKSRLQMCARCHPAKSNPAGDHSHQMTAAPLQPWPRRTERGTE